MALATALLGGCWSSGPSRVQPPDIDAGDAGDQAIELYDKDGDGSIAGAELDAVPGVKAAMETIDSDKDGKITADEIAARIEAWQATRIGVMPLHWTVTLDGRPLAGATVTFEPESFLGDQLKSAVGETSSYGTVSPTVPKDQRATPDTPSGFQPGLYRVRVSKMAGGQETIPAKYNTETILGQQIAPDDPAVANQAMHLKLTTK
jgi:hypothetical protein